MLSEDDGKCSGGDNKDTKGVRCLTPVITLDID